MIKKVAISFNILFDFTTKWGRQRLVKFDASGRIYIPKLIRKLFRDCYFHIEVQNGKIILNPVKLDELEDGGGDAGKGVKD